MSELSASPLRSSETFESYCTEVQVRLAEHAAQRLNFLQSAHDRLTRLLQTARAVEDTGLYNELWQHRVAVRELLDSLNKITAPSNVTSSDPISPALTTDSISANSISSASAPAAPLPSMPLMPSILMPAAPVPAAPISSTASSVAAIISTSIASSATSATSAPGASTYPAQPLSANPIPLHNPSAANGHNKQDKSEAGAVPKAEVTGNGLTPLSPDIPAGASAEMAPRAVRQPVRALSDIEADAARLRETLRDWNSLYPLHSSHAPDGELHIPNCLRLRAVACRMRRLEEEAGDMEVAEVTELARDIEDLLDEAGDEEYTVALDYDIDPQPTAYQWGELAERYEETAHAEEAFEWWIAHRAVLSVADVQALAESVAAIQQRFNRLLFRIGARDPFQQQLFDDLRIWAKEAQCYLYSLRPKVPIVELIEKAQTIDAAWEQAREPLREQEERQHAIQTILDMVSAPDFGAREEEDRVRLQQGLLQCKHLRIPASERRLRDALLPWAAFLESSEHLKEWRQEITLEQERRQESSKPIAMNQ